jgi:hypothetical protein
MKLGLVLLLSLAACGPGIKQAPETPPTQGFATRFASAASAGDAATLRAMMGPHVTLGGLWFPDATCQQEFAGTGEIAGGRLDELARCLTTVKLTVSPRKDSLLDVAVLTYDPGFEIEARFIDGSHGPWLSWIGYEARKDAADALPTITPEALEALRTAGQRDPSLPGIEGTPQAPVYAWVKTCIDAQGKVTGAHVREASSLRAARLFQAAIADWAFKPFIQNGQALQVCSFEVLGEPLADVLAHARIPLPTRLPDGTMMVATSSLQMTRGTKMIVPDDGTKTEIQRSRVSRLIGTFQLCIDEQGKVGNLAMLRSTGAPTYDGEIMREMAHWEYAPYIDEGKAVPVCTAVTFIYSQR